MASLSMVRGLSTKIFTVSGRPCYSLCLSTNKLQSSNTYVQNNTFSCGNQAGPLQIPAGINMKNMSSETVDEKVEYSPELVRELTEKMEGDMPLDCMPNPFTEERKKCILCKYNIELDYKNTRLLSQFVSPFTGRIYGRKITGLCIPMQQRVATLIKRSRKCGFMPFIVKDAAYLQDPKLFDPFKPAR